MQIRIRGLPQEKAATKTKHTRPSLVSLGRYTRPLRPRLQLPKPHVRCQPALQMSPSSWRLSSLAPPTVLSSVCAKLVQWCRTRLTAHLNQHTRTACSQHPGLPNQWFHLSKREPEMATPRLSRLRWALRLQDTTLHRHPVPAVRKRTTSCQVFASRQSSHGVSPESTALSPITPEASHPEKLLRQKALRCGQTMQTRPLRVAMSLHLIRSGARHHRCLVTLGLVAIDQRGAKIHRSRRRALSPGYQLIYRTKLDTPQP